MCASVLYFLKLKLNITKGITYNKFVFITNYCQSRIISHLSSNERLVVNLVKGLKLGEHFKFKEVRIKFNSFNKEVSLGENNEMAVLGSGNGHLSHDLVVVVVILFQSPVAISLL